MSLPVPSSLPLVAESPDDELRYFLTYSQGLVRRRLVESAKHGEAFNATLASLHLLDELIAEQLPALEKEAVGGEK